MKNLLLALLAVTGISAFAPRAEAGQFARVYTNRGVIYAHKADVYGQSYVNQVAHNNYYGQPYYRNSACQQPRRRAYYSNSRCAPRYSRPVFYAPNRSCNGFRAPRFAFGF